MREDKSTAIVNALSALDRAVKEYEKLKKETEEARSALLMRRATFLFSSYAQNARCLNELKLLNRMDPFGHNWCPVDDAPEYHDLLMDETGRVFFVTRELLQSGDKELGREEIWSPKAPDLITARSPEVMRRVLRIIELTSAGLVDSITKVVGRIGEKNLKLREELDRASLQLSIL